MLDLADLVSITTVSSTIVTDTCFELVDVMGLAKGGLANPPLEGEVLFSGRKYIINSYNITLESSNIAVHYQLVPHFFNDIVPNTDFDTLARSWGLKFKNSGSVDVVLWDGMPASLLFDAFHTICVRRKIERQLIVSVSEGLLFFGIPTTYPVVKLSFNMGEDMAFRGMYGKPAFWKNYYGNQYSVDEGDADQTVMSGGIFPPIGRKFCDIELTGDVLDWGIRYEFDTMPLLAKRKWYVYSKQASPDITKYTLCEV